MGKKVTLLFVLIVTLTGILFACSPAQKSELTSKQQSISTSSLERMKYNQSDLVVDLGVGAWAQPLPMDYDDDGDYDLLVSSHDKPYNGLYFFENTSGNVKRPVFKPAVRISHGLDDVAISYDGDKPIVTTPGKVYPNIKETGFYKSEPIPFKGEIHETDGRIRGNQWSFVDYNGNGVLDLIVGVGDWTDYGWDNAFTKNGKWTNGPLHGYVYYIKNEGTNEKPDYQKPVKLRAGDKPIDVYGKPTPVVADFNGDKKLDIITGEFLDKLTFFENTGTKTAPKYASGQYLQNGINTIKMDLQMLTVSAIDWTKDGRMDLIVGQEDGRVALLENTGEVVGGRPIFKDPYFFQQQADDVKVGILPTPVNFDWNGDGKDDLIVGDSAGRISFVENLDGGNSPKWAAPVYLKADEKEIRIQAGDNGSIQGPAEAKWGYTTPSVEDWNHDGLPDILINSIWGKVLWYENIGTRRSPILAAAKPIEVEWKGKTPKPEWNWWNPEGDDLVTQWRTTPYVIDLNKDGLNDLVMLDQEGYLAFFERQKVDGELKLLPGKRIFIGEEGSSKFDHNGKAIYAPKGPIQMNTGVAGRSGRRKFTMVDWNQDGKLDLITNGERNVKLLLNVGTKDEPFLFTDKGDIADGVLVGHDTAPTVVDWDNNKVPDLLIGAEDGRFYYLKNNFKEEQPRDPAPTGKLHDLVGYWNFEKDENMLVKDSSENNNFGVVHGASSISGYQGKGLSFDGFDDFVDLDYTVGNYLDGAEGITVTGWINLAEIESRAMCIFCSNINGEDAGIELSMKGKFDSIQMSGRSQASDEFSKKLFPLENISLDEWHHIAGVLDFKNNRIRFYIDGVAQKATNNSSVEFGSKTYKKGKSAGEDAIGRNTNQTEYFKGKLDEVHVFRRALTREEIKEMFEKHN